VASRKPPLHVSGLSKFFLVVLRIAIGWHLCYEGLCKLDPHWLSLMRGKEPKALATPWTAEGYLRVATGPLRHQFRGMIPDVDGLRLLDAGQFRTMLEDDLREKEARYGLTADQAAGVKQRLKELIDQAAGYLAAEKTAVKVSDYRRDLEQWNVSDRADRYGGDDGLRKKWETLEGARRELTGPLEGWRKDLHNAALAALTPAQAQRPRSLTLAEFRGLSPLAQSDIFTAWGLTICGGCLVLGLFTRLAALGAAGFLALFYISLPPWPGLPAVPGTEGNYLVVNKNLIEMLACLALATLPTGAWGGLDAFLRGLFLRPLLGVGAREEKLAQRLDDDY
jgi:uncharacterized membrane protein YphA (DoxX/SURF4 family)